MESIFESKVQFLMKECEVDKGTATVALMHTKGSVSFAKDFLSNETCRRIYGREAKEFDVG